MTSPSSALLQGARDNFDIGPLSWVMGEIREALNRSKAALHEAATQDADAQATSIRHAKTYLHQAHGALQMVDVDGIAIITETVEDLLDRVAAGQMELLPDLAQVIDNSYQALVEYLEELLAGASHQPVRLFPYYRLLLEARGAERIHPADLFFPNLSIRPQLPPLSTEADTEPGDYLALRQRFEKALLPFLKSTDRSTELAHAAAMRDIIADIEGRQRSPQVRSFWWVMHGLAEAMAAGQIESEIYVKQLFARINLQIRHLCKGSSSIAERLLRDALFFIAKAKNPSSHAQQICATYQLDGLVPADYDRKRYGQIDPDALATAKERLAQAKSMWNRIAGGDEGIAESFEHEIRVLADAASRLNSPPLAKLLRQLKGIVRHAAQAKPGDTLGLEMASALLFVENSLNHIGRLPDHFDERAEVLTARLLAIVSGDVPPESVQWLDDMSREAQQRQTVAALAGEMQASLRQVEKMLDEYFRDSAQRDALPQLDAMLYQIEGALAVLDQNDAMRTIQHTRAAVQRFVDAEDEVMPAQQEFQHVAQNIGALSFFLETLQLDSEEAKKRFAFDEERGIFEASLLEKSAVAENGADEIALEMQALPVDDPESPEPAMQAVEDASENRQQSVELPLTTLPDDESTLSEQAPLDASQPEMSETGDPVQPGSEAPDQPSPAPAAGSSPSSVEVPTSDEAIDAELLEIFLSEAVEVLGAVRQTLPESRNAPHNQEHLTTLRRAFHTLKGSGRMVGLVAFGEAAWSIEQVLNLRLSESRGGDPDLYALLDKAAEVLGEWVQDLQELGGSELTPYALVAAAARVKAGGRFSYDEDKASAVAEPPNDAGACSETAPLAESLLPPAVPEQLEQLEPADGQSDGMQPDVVSDAQDFASEVLAPLPVAEEIQLSDADLAMFGASSDVPDVIDDEMPVEAGAADEGSMSAEVIDFPKMSAPEQEHNDNVKYIGELEISVPLHNIYLAETDELVRLLAQDIAEWRHEPERKVTIQAVHAAHSLAGSSATVGFSVLQEAAHALEMVLQSLARKPVWLTEHEFDTLEQSVERLKLMLQKFALGEMPACQSEYARLLNSIRHDIEARADRHGAAASTLLAGFPGVDPVHDNADDVEGFMDTVAEIEEPATFPPAPDNGGDTLFRAPRDVEAESTLVPQDELDVDLLPVFVEEGSDMLPEMGAALRSWPEQQDNGGTPQLLLRLLHTLKGSARMAGAMSLGQHFHDMETRVENLMRLGAPSPLALDDLLVRYDQALHLFDQLQNPVASQQAAAVEPGVDETVAIDDCAAAPELMEPVVLSPLMPLPTGNFPSAPAARQVAVPAGSAPLVRVRADILDRLVNQAGEVSISRSKLETEVGTLRQSLSELTDNVARLRGQLREVEMQAESQITSRMANSADREFDPLEFDRFTRLQELTRMMAESVNDVGSVHQNLSRTLDSATGDLSIQARLTRDLQQDLMRVRMVQFASISERLFRVTRQAAKEVDKRINLDIRGSGVELDRGVLEKMTGPFEHLLRNAIVHGIEAREIRQAAGKNEVGELLVEVRQEGNEVVISFSDDGQGLHIDRIRDKASRLGLLNSDEPLSEEDVRDLIFHPGFSTADEVTELAGRGVGMDVVRSEAAALGGRVATWSEPGKGTHFTIHLPLTLAVTQVVLLSTGGKVYAVPSVLVEQVQQLKTNALTAAYNDGAVVWQEQRVPMHYLSALLGDAAASPVAQHYTPLMILKSGNDRIAVHVDQIIGNREVVVKNIGPQLARMIGIAGATVLGSGDIVLILNPVPLAQRVAHDNMRAPRLTQSDMPETMGAVAELAPQRPATPESRPVQGLRRQNIVMVVDDSLTVRRVTQRLLTREGYQVVLAKDGVDALEHLQSVTPDVMLVDIEMPRMDGFDLTRNVRDDERTRKIPIIMITSRTAAKHRNYALELGVNDYLGKPYQDERLLELIAGFINRETPVA